MRRITLCLMAALGLALVPSLASATDPGGAALREILQGTRAQTNDLMRTCAAEQGLATFGESIFLSSDDSVAAIIATEGADKLTRADLAVWRTIGIIDVAGPPDAQSPSGVFTVRVQADLGKTRGKFQIVDKDGMVVQEGEMTIEEAAEDPAPDGEWHAYPCYYPYYPYFRIYPYYYYGCHWWYYHWYWGHIRFRYCWWPYYGCCWWYRCCW